MVTLDIPIVALGLHIQLSSPTLKEHTPCPSL